MAEEEGPSSIFDRQHYNLEMADNNQKINNQLGHLQVQLQQLELEKSKMKDAVNAKAIEYRNTSIDEEKKERKSHVKKEKAGNDMSPNIRHPIGNGESATEERNYALAQYYRRK